MSELTKRQINKEERHEKLKRILLDVYEEKAPIEDAADQIETLFKQRVEFGYANAGGTFSASAQAPGPPVPAFHERRKGLRRTYHAPAYVLEVTADYHISTQDRREIERWKEIARE